MAADIGYHSPVSLYQRDDGVAGDYMSEECPVLGGKCFYDGSSLMADHYLETLKNEGSEGVWRAMEGYYKTTFAENNDDQQT